MHLGHGADEGAAQGGQVVLAGDVRRHGVDEVADRAHPDAALDRRGGDLGGADRLAKLDHADPAEAIERGVWVRPFRDLVYTMPPYVTGEHDLATLCGALVGAVAEVHG